MLHPAYLISRLWANRRVILWGVAGVVAMALIGYGVWQFSPASAYIVVGVMLLILVIGAAYEPANSGDS